MTSVVRETCIEDKDKKLDPTVSVGYNWAGIGLGQLWHVTAFWYVYRYVVNTKSENSLNSCGTYLIMSEDFTEWLSN